MTDVERIAEAVHAAVAGIVLNGGSCNPQVVVAGLERAQLALERVEARWSEIAREYAAGESLRGLRTEIVQVALSDLEREQVGGTWAFKTRKGSTAAKALEHNGWREVKRRHSARWFVMPDGSGPPAHLTPVAELAVPAREEVIRLAGRLHAAKAEANCRAGGLFLSYSPSSALRMTSRSGKEYMRRHPARLLMHGDAWGVAATWPNGDGRPPVWWFSWESAADGRPLPEPALRLVVGRQQAGP